MSRFHLRTFIVAVLLSLSIQGFGSVRVKASTPIETLYTGLNFPVSITFAPDGRIFYNEKNTGYIRVIQNGVILSTPFATVPLPPGSGPLSVNSTEQGLLGIALDPNFETNGYVYAYWTHLNATYKQVIITRWTAVGNTGQTPDNIFNFTDPNPPDQQPQVGGPTNHNGGYMKFGPDGKLYVEVGDFCSEDCLNTPLAQQLDTYAGKILRMNPDGTVPGDNPFPGSLIWAYGYRNGVGMDFSPSGALTATMAGPDCCDRILRVSQGANFGWPNCGIDSQHICSSPYVGSIYEWGAPTVTPTGIAYSLNPSILYFGEFNTGNFMQLILTTGGTGQISTVASGFGGVIAVERAPDGSIWFSTPDTIYRYTPPPLILSLTNASPGNGTLLDSTLANLQVRATSNGFIPGVNETIYVNGTELCNGLSDNSGIFGCNYQVTKQGRYDWNVTIQSTNSTFLRAYFTVGLIVNLELVNGWNLISLPIVPASNTIGSVLASQIAGANFSVVWSYQGGSWRSAVLNPMTHVLSGPLTTMQDGLGYWIYMTHAGTLYVTGFVFAPPPASPSAYTLTVGWNLIGFKPQPDATASETVSAYLTSISGNYDVNNVWLYSAET